MVFGIKLNFNAGQKFLWKEEFSILANQRQFSCRIKNITD